MGIEADVFEGRWKGITDLDSEGLNAIALDGLVLAVVAFRVEEAGATKVMKDGRKRRKDVFDVTDVRMLVGEQREVGVRFLEGRGDFVPTPPELEAGEESAIGASIRELRAVVRGDVYGPTDPEASEFEDDTFVADAGVDEGTERISVFDYKKAARPAGPKPVGVAKFDPNSFDDDPGVSAGDVERIGSVRNAGYQGKDPVLKRFLED